MYDYTSQGRAYWRCFSWLGDGVRCMNTFPVQPLGRFKGWSMTTLFGDDYFWLLRPEASQT